MMRMELQVMLQSHQAANESSEFWGSDNSWNAEIVSTGWLGHVGQCLDWTRKAIKKICTHERSIIIRDAEGRDVSAIVSSLVQLCLDPHFRTLNGFVKLMQKEWVALGHPFGLRHHGLETKGLGLGGVQKDQMAPVFLLFLDCIHQMIKQWPSAFEFTEHYLIALWDLSYLGITRTFTLNSLHRHAGANHSVTGWYLSHFYEAEYIHLFRNPLYSAEHGIRRGAAPTLKLCHDELGHRSELDCQDRMLDLLLPDNQLLLMPHFGPDNLTFWNGAYQRWQSPAQWVGGGDIVKQFHLLDLVGTVSDMQMTLLKLLKKCGRRRSLSGEAPLPQAGGALPNVRLEKLLRQHDIARPDPRLLQPELTTSGLPYTSECLSAVDELVQPSPMFANPQSLPASPKMPPAEKHRMGIGELFGPASYPENKGLMHGDMLPLSQVTPTGTSRLPVAAGDTTLV